MSDADRAEFSQWADGIEKSVKAKAAEREQDALTRAIVEAISSYWSGKGAERKPSAVHKNDMASDVAAAIAPLLEQARTEERIKIVHFLVDTSRQARARAVVAGLRHAAMLIDADTTRARLNELNLLRPRTETS